MPPIGIAACAPQSNALTASLTPWCGYVTLATGGCQMRPSNESSVKRPRISLDVLPELRRRVRLAAARRDVTVQEYVREAIEERLRHDLPDDARAASLTAATDPVLAELWANPR